MNNFLKADKIITSPVALFSKYSRETLFISGSCETAPIVTRLIIQIGFLQSEK